MSFLLFLLLFFDILRTYLPTYLPTDLLTLSTFLFLTCVLLGTFYLLT